MNPNHNLFIAFCPRLLVVIPALVVGSMLLPAVIAQEQSGDGTRAPGNQQPQEFAERYNLRHLDQPPLLNERVPEVEIFDAEGNPFATGKFRGRYTVLVFGCLT